MNRAAPSLVPLALGALALGACGDNFEGIPDEILPESIYAARCETPRSGTDPTTNQPFEDKAGSLLDEKLWLRSWINDLYLWYPEVPSVDITAYTDPIDYFDQLKTPALTPSGNPKDQFHFVYDTNVWVSLSQSGTEASYGAEWALIKSKPPRKVVAAFVRPASPAASANLVRGTQILTIDGVDVENGDKDPLNAGLYPADLHETHTFVVQDPGATTRRTVTLTSATVAITPVQIAGTLPAPNDKVGYIQFTDHIATAEKELVDAITQLRTKGVTDLILDIRYNGGGYLDIASELAYMIAGPNATAGKTFERLTFNDKYPTIDPVTGQPLAPEEFIDHTEGFSLDPGQPLPFLGLSRVFVLTSFSTASASESVMNSLSGVNVQVIQIGTTTRGKPYGFYPADNCGTTYFAIQFRGVNNKGFGDYADGFVPGQLLEGCVVADDFTHQLGDPAEAQVAAALSYRADLMASRAPTCPPTTSARRAGESGDAVIRKPLWRDNRIIRR